MLLEKIKEIKISSNKKTIENLVIFLVLAIIVIIVINTLFEKEDSKEVTNIIPNVETNNNTNDLEKKLEDILSEINGVGDAKVMISYISSLEQVPMYDTRESITITEETDRDGGQRKTEQTNNEKTIIYEEQNNSRDAMIKQTIMPEIVGVIVVAKGAGDINVKNKIINAVEAVVNIGVHRIQVFEKR